MLTYLYSIIIACLYKKKHDDINDELNHHIIDIRTEKRLLDTNDNMPNKRIKLC